MLTISLLLCSLPCYIACYDATEPQDDLMRLALALFLVCGALGLPALIDARESIQQRQAQAIPLL